MRSRLYATQEEAESIAEADELNTSLVSRAGDLKRHTHADRASVGRHWRRHSVCTIAVTSRAFGSVNFTHARRGLHVAPGRN